MITEKEFRKIIEKEGERYNEWERGEKPKNDKSGCFLIIILFILFQIKLIL